MRNAITVHNNRMPLVEFQGQRVVTFAMVDEAHQRPDGTAAATFRRHRHRFTEKQHFFELTGDVLHRQTFPGLFPAHTRKGIVITEMGYLLLVKPFHDDLSWVIQEELVNAYFRHIPQFPELHKVRVPDAAELVEMPLQQGQKGSAAMRLRRDELKKLRPATRFVRERGQIEVADTGDYADE